jgi:hypothetical protein
LSSAVPVAPSADDVLIQRATLAAHVQEMLAAVTRWTRRRWVSQPAKNQRRRAMETILVLLADSGVRRYVSEVERLGLVQIKR